MQKVTIRLFRRQAEPLIEQSSISEMKIGSAIINT